MVCAFVMAYRKLQLTVSRRQPFGSERGNRLRVGQMLVHGNVEGQPDPEGRAAALLALYLDPAAVAVHDRLGDAEPQADALDRALERRAGVRKNRLKTWLRSRTLMPMPVSITTSSTRSWVTEVNHAFP